MSDSCIYARSNVSFTNIGTSVSSQIGSGDKIIEYLVIEGWIENLS